MADHTKWTKVGLPATPTDLMATRAHLRRAGGDSLLDAREWAEDADRLQEDSARVSTA